MRSKAISAVLLASLLLGAGCVVHSDIDVVRGSGNVLRQVRTVEAFDRIDVSGAVRVVVEVGGERAVRVEADDNIAPLVETRVRRRTLRISSKSPWRSGLDEGVRVFVTVPSLRAFSVGGSCSGTLEGLAGPRFDLRVSGAATLALRGAVETFEIDVSGSGRIDAEQLRARQVDADVSGAGEVRVNATESLDATVSGVGTILFAGSPANVQRKVRGIGRIEPI